MEVVVFVGVLSVEAAAGAAVDAALLMIGENGWCVFLVFVLEDSLVLVLTLWG
jgi:hypothetical protein